MNLQVTHDQCLLHELKSLIFTEEGDAFSIISHSEACPLLFSTLLCVLCGDPVLEALLFTWLDVEERGELK